jgi:acyl carrier protein
LADGNIEFLGRIDHQVKIRGYRIEMGEIENQLLSHSEIKEVVVMPGGEENQDKYICAYIVSNRELATWELKEYLARNLPGYMVPSYFIPMEKIPLTANGKIDRKTLPDPEIKVGRDYVAPGDDVENCLVEIWSEVLGAPKDKISIDANFFDMGGHSLKVTIMATKIYKKLNVELSLIEIFKVPTIKAIADLIRTIEWANYQNPGISQESEEIML